MSSCCVHSASKKNLLNPRLIKCHLQQFFCEHVTFSQKLSVMGLISVRIDNSPQEHFIKLDFTSTSDYDKSLHDSTVTGNFHIGANTCYSTDDSASTSGVENNIEDNLIDVAEQSSESSNTSTHLKNQTSIKVEPILKRSHNKLNHFEKKTKEKFNRGDPPLKRSHYSDINIFNSKSSKLANIEDSDDGCISAEEVSSSISVCSNNNICLTGIGGENCGEFSSSNTVSNNFCLVNKSRNRRKSCNPQKSSADHGSDADSDAKLKLEESQMSAEIGGIYSNNNNNNNLNSCNSLDIVVKSLLGLSETQNSVANSIACNNNTILNNSNNSNLMNSYIIVNKSPVDNLLNDKSQILKAIADAVALPTSSSIISANNNVSSSNSTGGSIVGLGGTIGLLPNGTGGYNLVLSKQSSGNMIQQPCSTNSYQYPTSASAGTTTINLLLPSNLTSNLSSTNNNNNVTGSSTAATINQASLTEGISTETSPQIVLIRSAAPSIENSCVQSLNKKPVNGNAPSSTRLLASRIRETYVSKLETGGGLPIGSSGGKIYRCTFCNKVFNRKFCRERHERLHTGVKPYCCEHCGEKFIRLEDKKRHLRSLHNDEEEGGLCGGASLSETADPVECDASSTSGSENNNESPTHQKK